jgi:hypothetical protein
MDSKMTETTRDAETPTPDYGFNVGDSVSHVGDNDIAGIVTELDSDHDLGGVTTCRVAWGAQDLSEAMLIPRGDQDIQWTNKLVATQ